MRFVSVMYYHTFVSPGTGATLQTLPLLSVLITLLLPTLGYPTMPTVMLCELGLYALSSRRSAGAVEDERFDRWWLPADLNGSVGVVWRR